MKNVMVFAPHPDDEVLGCGGTIAKKIASDDKVYVVFMTDGRYALREIGIDANPNPFELKTIRKEEALKAAKMLGLREEDMFFLDIEDKSLNTHKKNALGHTLKILKELRPAEIFYPQELEYNIDHRATTLIVKEALKKLELNVVEYQYAVAWKFPFNLLLHTLGEFAFYKSMCVFLKRNLLYVDISNFLLIKKMAIKQYMSQLKPYSDNQGKRAIKQSILRISLRDKEKFFV
jgi:LmbE family N-acetylglucosaminyl deacetylase